MRATQEQVAAMKARLAERMEQRKLEADIQEAIMMDFDGKDAIMQKISKNARLQQMFAFYVQQTFMMATASGNAALAQQAAMDMQQYLGMTAAVPAGGTVSDVSGGYPEESGITRKARERTANTTAPREG